LPLNITEAISGLICGVITHRFHAQKELIVVGTILMVLGTGLYVKMNAGTPLIELIVFQLIAGFGIGNLFNPPIIVIQNETPQEHVATATSTQAFVRNMATAVGVVIGSIIFEHGMAARSVNLRRAGLPSDLLDKFSGSKAAANVGLVKTITDARQAQAVKDAFAWSIRNMFIFYTCVAAVGLIASFFIRSSKLSSEHVETRTGLLSTEKDPQDVELHSRPGEGGRE
jgi:MFS family permease